MTNSNVNPLTTMAAHFAALSGGLYDASRGDGLVRDGTAKAIVSIVAMLKAAHDDEDTFTQIVRNVGGIHVNAKEQPEAFKASWAWWQEQLATYGDKRKHVAFNTVEMSAEDKETIKNADTADKRELNAPKQSAVRTLRIACSAAYALATTNVIWANVTFSKGNDALFLLNADAKRLFPKNEKNIDKNKRADIEVSTFTTPNFAALVRFGNDALIKAKIKNAPPAAKDRADRAVPVRDIVAKMGDTVENADSKAFDVTTRLASFSALIKLIDALNDTNVQGHLDSAKVKPFREYIAEEMEKVTPKVQAA